MSEPTNESPAPDRADGAADKFRLLAHLARVNSVPRISLEDALCIATQANWLCQQIFEKLPYSEGQVLRNAGAVRTYPHWLAQTCAYTIEALANPSALRFGRKSRQHHFCTSRGGKVVLMGAKQFLAAFDSVCRHYGWQNDTSRAAWDAVTRVGPVWLPVYLGPADAVMEPPPPPITAGALSALKRAAKRLVTDVLREVPRRVEPKLRRVVARAVMPLDLDMFIRFILYVHPDWSATQIAKTAGISRSQLYRVIAFTEIRGRIAAQGRADIPPGESYTEPDTGNRRHDGYVRDEHLEALRDDDE
jgi:hypothetical protein